MEDNKKNRSITALFTRNFIIMVILVTMVIVSILSLLFANIAKSHNDNSIINILGRQRMLTQTMAKSANRIYVLRDSIEVEMNNGNIEMADEYARRLVATKEDLIKSRGEYDRVFGALSSGYLTVDNMQINFEKELKELDAVIKDNKEKWGIFKSSIDIIVNDTTGTMELIDAVRYINENNEILLKYSEQITEVVLNYSRKQNISIMYTAVAITIASLIAFIIMFRRVYRQLFVPVNQLYKGMAEVGVTRLQTCTPRTEVEELQPVFSEVNEVFNKLNSLIKLIESLNKDIPFKDVLNYIYNSFSEFIPYTYIGIALIEEDGRTIRASYGVTSNYHKNLPKKLLGYKTDIGDTSLFRILESGEERVINDLEDYLFGKPQKEYNNALLEEGIRASITFPLKNNGKNVGIIFFSSNIKNVYRKEHVEFLRTIANSIILSLEKSIFFDDMIIGSIQALARLAEQRDPETGEHIQRMKIYSKVIAEILFERHKYKDEIDIDYISDIERFSPLHDIGKVGIRDDILLKTGKLTKDEFEIMKFHTVYGGWVLKAAEETVQKRGRNIFKLGIEIAEGHHEKWDGTGYPKGLSGENIPLSARIVAAADVFDALTSKRPYKEAFSFEESCNIIIEGSGRHFDPTVSNIFIEHIDKIKKVYDDFKTAGML